MIRDSHGQCDKRAYVELARLRNGGGVKRCAFPMSVPTGWAEDHISITGIFAIGRTANWSLLGELGATNAQDEWGYPAWGVGFADTPSGGHELIRSQRATPISRNVRLANAGRTSWRMW